MKTFTYWNNKEKWHGQKLAEIKEKTILEADKELEKQTKFNVVKCPWISCEVND